MTSFVALCCAIIVSMSSFIRYIRSSSKMTRTIMKIILSSIWELPHRIIYRKTSSWDVSLLLIVSSRLPIKRYASEAFESARRSIERSQNRLSSLFLWKDISYLSSVNMTLSMKVIERMMIKIIMMMMITFLIEKYLLFW